MSQEHIHFVTGRLAEHSLRDVLAECAAAAGFRWSVEAMPISVAALMTPAWISTRIAPPREATRMMIPGYCEGDLAPLVEAAGVPVERGPRDLRRLPEHFGQTSREDYGQFDIEILAEINHAPRLPLKELLQRAEQLAAAGADLIDVGCDPGEPWSGVGKAVAALRDRGFRVSIDSLDPREIAPAVKAGAELVLSVNGSNRRAAVDWGVEVVAIPDVPDDLASLDQTVAFLADAGVPLRIDPILEPIGFGFAQSLGRYLEVRRRYPDAEMMMGIGNLTELTDVDSAGINVLLLGFCQELGIRSVLTTEEIPWARTSTRECDLARRLVHYAVNRRVLPKHLETRLVTLRDANVVELSEEELDRLAAELKDPNYRLFTSGNQLHAVSAGLHLSDADPFALFEKLLADAPDRIDPGHAFYLGYELCKAYTALVLGKQYQQDDALDWGLLTVPEHFHRLKRPPRRRDARQSD